MNQITARDYFPGMGAAVADRTVNRRIFTDDQRASLPKVLKLNQDDLHYKAWSNAAELSGHPFKVDDKAAHQKSEPETRMERWEEVAKRVAEGNTSLVEDEALGLADRDVMEKHLRQASLLMSGRHLQHGDIRQKDRPMEVFTNCSSAAAAFLKFYLLLNGSGVGRSYDDAMMKVDWRKMPTVYVAIDDDYKDRQIAALDGNGMMVKESVNSIAWFKKAIKSGKIGATEKVTIFDVSDSRSGWAKGIEVIERMAYEGRSDEVLILDFSGVRSYGSPIRGMQNRPSSGPGPLMDAIMSLAAVKFLDLEPWEATMHVDHFLSACVMVGGARRAARMATKYWKDAGIFRFINIKQSAGLWSSNNSVTIDEEFRTACVRMRGLVKAYPVTPVESMPKMGLCSPVEAHAWAVLNAIAEASYHHGTGEPGIINQDKLTAKDDGIEDYLDGLFAGSRDYQVDDSTLDLMKELAASIQNVKYTMITNPCGEITLLMLGAYCVIADVVPFHATSDDDAEEAFRVAVRALIRTNTMDSLYKREVKRTNRIGVGITGLHEWIYARFKFAWKDIIDEEKSMEMWQMLSRFKRAIVDEARTFSELMGVVVPHTDTTEKPAGTTSKLFGLSEGAHLPSMRFFLRWVQFRNDDPLVQEYADKGYPVRKLTTYPGVSIVGFPTAPAICQMDGGEWVTTASEATPTEQYQYLRLLEKYWIVGVAEDGVTPLAETGNQISYTLKYDPNEVSYEEFFETMIDGQFSIRCCSVMPKSDMTAYEYQPEEPISAEVYKDLMQKVEGGVKEEIDFAHVDCGSGGCPIDFEDRAVA